MHVSDLSLWLLRTSREPRIDPQCSALIRYWDKNHVIHFARLGHMGFGLHLCAGGT